MQEPLCGLEWYLEHRNDHTVEEIADLSLELVGDGKTQIRIEQGNEAATGVVKKIITIKKEQSNARSN